MAVLAGVSTLAGFLVDFWINVITWFNASISNYAWSIIVLTVAIKLVMTPLDFLNKKTTRKNTKLQAAIQPQLEKLQKKYGNDKNLYNQKTAELYKANNYNMVGSCLFMLTNLVLTMVVFISLFSGLNYMSSLKIVDQYNTLKTEYYNEYNLSIDNLETNEQAILNANQSVSTKYKQVKYDWLWIENVWKADSITNSIPTVSEFLQIAKEVTIEGETIQVSELTDEQKQNFETEYNLIMNPLRDTDGKTNGYLILFVLTVGTAFLSQWLMQRKNKMITASENSQAASTGKIMMFVLPVMLGFFALTYNSVFSLYLLTSQIIAIATTPLIDLIIDAMEKKKEEKAEAVLVADYNRKRLSKEESTIVYEKAKIKKEKKLEKQKLKSERKDKGEK